MTNIEQEIKAIKKRNSRVEIDKAWETSLTRTIIIIGLIYVFALIYSQIIDVTNPFLGAVIPCGGYLISTFSLKIIKRLWQNNYERRYK
ncbi:MAG TPA: hypothetical protein PK737_00650 [Bacilli bacterium]|nr:hypothetical protein [Bacilli bacterium]